MSIGGSVGNDRLEIETGTALGYIWLGSPVIGTLIHSDHKSVWRYTTTAPAVIRTEMASVAASLGGAWSLPVKSSLPFSLTSTSRGLVLHRAKIARRCGSPPADTAPAVSPTTAPPLASSAAETAGSNSPPSSGQPGGQASTSLTPLSAHRAGAESASARSPTPVTAESSTEPEDSAVGSTSPPLSSASSAPSQPTSVSLGLRSGADDSLSSPPEVSWCRKDVGAAWSY
ncbi:unnamed protein product [Phytophthora fragariaefolia]|uniref:Unnamed protein product n=1 Tax=Phytophthora fragariaefolia TaxID=1490495 RepID=A0A9W6XLW0_9STRA|nr:unnamed protein product [Phytophthora fragariaefolia]